MPSIKPRKPLLKTPSFINHSKNFNTGKLAVFKGVFLGLMVSIYHQRHPFCRHRQIRRHLTSDLRPVIMLRYIRVFGHTNQKFGRLFFLFYFLSFMISQEESKLNPIFFQFLILFRSFFFLLLSLLYLSCENIIY